MENRKKLLNHYVVAFSTFTVQSNYGEFGPQKLIELWNMRFDGEFVRSSQTAIRPGQRVTSLFRFKKNRQLHWLKILVVYISDSRLETNFL